MRVAFSLGPQPLWLLFLAMRSVRVSASSLVNLNKYQEFLQAVKPTLNPLEAHPYTVFEDSFNYMWERLPEFCQTPLVGAEFKDDGKVDTARWIHLMTMQIFAPSFHLFSVHGEGSPLYDIYPASTFREEEEQLQYLRVAGRFVGKLIQMKLTINQQFVPNVYALLSEESSLDAVPQGVAKARLTAFLQGIHDIIPPEALHDFSQKDLALIMHGVPFEDLPDWKPAYELLNDASTPTSQSTLKSFEEVYKTLDSHSISTIWRLVSGMNRVPLCEIAEPRGFTVYVCTPPRCSLVGLSVDISKRMLGLSPVTDDRHMRSILCTRYSEQLVEYSWFKYSLRRLRTARPELPLPPNNILDSLIPVVKDNVQSFIESRVVIAWAEGDGVPKYMADHLFFLLSLPQIVRGPYNLFVETDGLPDLVCPIINLSLRKVLDEDSHLCRLYTAGLVIGKAIVESVYIPFGMSDRLYRSIRLGAESINEEEGFAKGTHAFARYEAFVKGVHRVIPKWMLSSLSAALIKGLIDPSEWSMPILVKLNDAHLSLQSCSEGREVLVETREKFWKALTSFSPTQIATFFWELQGRPAVAMHDFLGVKGGFQRFSVHPKGRSIEVSRNNVRVPAFKDSAGLLRQLNSCLKPTKLVRAAAGRTNVGVVEREDFVAIAQAGRIFENLLSTYGDMGGEQFIQKEFELVIVSEHDQTSINVQGDLNVGFLLLGEAFSAGRRLFAYDLDDYKLGAYHIYHGEVEDEQAHCDKLRFVGFFMAQLVIVRDLISEFPLAPRLQQLTYWGSQRGEGGQTTPAPPPLSQREKAFLEGFHSIAPPEAIQVITYKEWSRFLAAEQNLLLTQRGSTNTYQHFIDLCRLLADEDAATPIQEGKSPSPTTWEEYAQYVMEHPTQFVSLEQRSRGQLYGFTGAMFERERGLFVLEANEERYNLSEAAVRDEAKHREALHVGGILIGILIRKSYPVNFALSEALYSCIRHRGRFPKDHQASELMKARMEAFVGGVLMVVPPEAFDVLEEEEMARLFEWHLPLTVPIVRSQCIMPQVEPNSSGERALNFFWEAVESFPVVVRKQILRILCALPDITPRQFTNAPSPEFALNFDGGPLVRPVVKRLMKHVYIPVLDSMEDYRLSLFLLLIDGDAIGISRDVHLAKLSLGERLKAMRLKLEEQRNLKAEPESDDDEEEEEEEGGDVPSPSIKADRENLVVSAYECYCRNESLFTPRRWKITFVGADEHVEVGQDDGGMFNEWMGGLSKEILESKFSLFSILPTATCYSFSRLALVDSQDRQRLYRFVGIIFGRAFLSGVAIKACFPPVIYRLLLHQGDLDEFDYFEALHDLDPVAYENLKYVKENDVEELNLYFEVSDPEGKVYPLASDKEGQRVDEGNKHRYVSLMAKFILVGEQIRNIGAFIAGFQVMVKPVDLKAFLFTASEIEGVLYGREEIKVEEWKSVTEYSSTELPEDSELIRWFWEIVGEFDGEERRQLLHFCTGLSRVPFVGFEGIPSGKFKIGLSLQGEPEALPEATTCASILKLHLYDTKEKLREKLKKAIEVGARGFGVA